MQQMMPVSEEDIALWNLWKERIDRLSQEDCARLQRNARLGHPVFRSDLPLYAYFKEHFDKLGGMTPEISKRIGWDSP